MRKMDVVLVLLMVCWWWGMNGACSTSPMRGASREARQGAAAAYWWYRQRLEVLGQHCVRRRCRDHLARMEGGSMGSNNTHQAKLNNTGCLFCRAPMLMLAKNEGRPNLCVDGN
jgi:hypothetical protein